METAKIDYGANLLKRAEKYCNEQGGSIVSRQVQSLARVIAEDLYELKQYKNNNTNYIRVFEKMYSDLNMMDEDTTFTVKQIKESMKALEKAFS